MLALWHLPNRAWALAGVPHGSHSLRDPSTKSTERCLTRDRLVSAGELPVIKGLKILQAPYWRIWEGARLGGTGGLLDLQRTGA